MRFVRPLLVLALSAAVGLTPAALQAKPKTTAQKAAKLKKKHHHHHGFSGTVVKVHHNKQKKGHGTITVHVHHHHHKKTVANAPAAQPAQAKPAKPARTGATAIAKKHKKHHHLVKIHVTPQTKVEVVAKGLVPGKTTVKTVGSGKNKTKVPVTGKPKMATQHIPASFAHVHKGQHVHIHRHSIEHHHAKEVHIIHPSAQKQSSTVAAKPVNE
jgi:hypothetical protein